MRLHHIGIIVKDIDKSVNIYKKIGYLDNAACIYDPLQHIYIQIMKHSITDEILELVQPIDFSSSVYGHEIGKCHVCYEISDDMAENFISRFHSLNIGKIDAGSGVGQ